MKPISEPNRVGIDTVTLESIPERLLLLMVSAFSMAGISLLHHIDSRFAPPCRKNVT